MVEYLGVALGSEGAKKTALSWPPHPSIKRSYDVLKVTTEKSRPIVSTLIIRLVSFCFTALALVTVC